MFSETGVPKTRPARHSTIPVGASRSPIISSTGSRFAELPASLIVNADDWGATKLITDRILTCHKAGMISSASAMVFMQDSERAAELAQENFVDVGLHLNLSSAFTSAKASDKLKAHHERVIHFLGAGRFAATLFNPLLVRSFEYVTRAQLEEFEALYGSAPNRVDGHHHRHLAANVLLQKLLPEGTIARRNFTFAPGEKSGLNRMYRSLQDRALARRHAITDYMFNLVPLDNTERLRGIAELARRRNVEVETHPGLAEEFAFLMRGALLNVAPNVAIVRGYRIEGNKGRIPQTRSERGVEFPVEIRTMPHICVCVCTYQRAEMLRRLLRDLDVQESAGLFTYSIVIADNDPAESARSAVEEMRSRLHIPVKYCTEPRRGIARARNRVVSNAEGDYLAWIDDDEFPVKDWLLKLYRVCRRYEVDGVLGPVKRYFDQEPPAWLKRSRLYDRRVNRTGMQVAWKEARTGNVLIRRDVVGNDPAPFRVEFRAGEDQDFFRRKMEEGRRFVWSSDAVAYETVPPARWKRMYYVRKALFQGGTGAQLKTGPVSVAKSIVAVPLYTVALPFAMLMGQHRFMTLLVKLCDHSGKLLHLIGIDPIREEYVSD